VSSTPPEALPLQRWLARPALISAAMLTGAVALAWAWLFAWRMPIGEPMTGMPGMATAPDPWSAGYWLATFAMWALMMVAMMLPSAAPMVLLHARLDRGTPAQRMRDNALFALCYLLVWTAFAALAATAQAALLDSGVLAEASLAFGDRVLAAGVLLAAAAWQLTPAKAACLEQCRSPIQFVLRYWRPGAAGAVRLGVVHGLFCLGCCWGLMLLLFVGGVMNLAWVALLATLVFVEKLAPPHWRMNRWLALALAAGAAAVLLA
jgi:predicted metal-binding membrane protein